MAPWLTLTFGRKHQTIKCTPAVAAKVSDHAWSAEEVVEMIDTYFTDKLNAEFEEAFKAKYTPIRPKQKSYTPAEKVLPWYLDMTREAPPMPSDFL